MGGMMGTMEKMMGNTGRSRGNLCLWEFMVSRRPGTPVLGYSAWFWLLVGESQAGSYMWDLGLLGGLSLMWQGVPHNFVFWWYAGLRCGSFGPEGG